MEVAKPTDSHPSLKFVSKCDSMSCSCFACTEDMSSLARLFVHGLHWDLLLIDQTSFHGSGLYHLCTLPKLDAKSATAFLAPPTLSAVAVPSNTTWFF